MKGPQRTAAEVLRDIQATLQTAELGLRLLLEGSPETRLSAFRNVVVFGRAVTNALQGLRHVEPAFEEWYAPHKLEMEADPLLKYLYDLRSTILKEGRLETSSVVHIRRLSWPSDAYRLGPPPPNARGFFIGDSCGGAGWEIELPDGSVDKYYVSLPGDIGAVYAALSDAPSVHLGRPLPNRSLETLATLYVDYLRKLVRSAEGTFGGRR